MPPFQKFSLGEQFSSQRDLSVSMRCCPFFSPVSCIFRQKACQSGRAIILPPLFFHLIILPSNESDMPSHMSRTTPSLLPFLLSTTVDTGAHIFLTFFHHFGQILGSYERAKDYHPSSRFNPPLSTAVEPFRSSLHFMLHFVFRHFEWPCYSIFSNH